MTLLRRLPATALTLCGISIAFACGSTDAKNDGSTELGGTTALQAGGGGGTAQRGLGGQRTAGEGALGGATSVTSGGGGASAGGQHTGGALAAGGRGGPWTGGALSVGGALSEDGAPIGGGGVGNGESPPGGGRTSAVDGVGTGGTLAEGAAGLGGEASQDGSGTGGAASEAGSPGASGGASEGAAPGVGGGGAVSEGGTVSVGGVGSEDGSGGGGTGGASGASGTGGGMSGTGLGCGQQPGDPPLAFPCAEGFGRMASGGRLGDVVHVTNLDDSGAGSFRDAVSEPNRIVVFDVGGVINIDTRVVVMSNITIAGQTAPGGGITIYGNGIALNGDSGGGNVIIRYLRVRMGANGDSGKDAVSISLGENYMLDHVSISWGRDGTLDVNGTPIDNLSFQECIISQGINMDNHSTGGLMQPSGVDGRWSMIRSLYIDNKTRNPKARGKHEFINSVLYNWAEHGYIMGDTTGGVSECNLVGNYFVYGPSSNADTHITGTTEYFHVYAADNWVDSNKNGVLDGSLLTDFKTATVVDAPFDYPAGVSGKLSAQAALAHVAEHAGASLVRDAVDDLLLEQLRSNGTEGQIITQESDNGIPNDVGTVEGGTPPADTDRDGMPDAWELGHGLDPNAPDDSGDDDGDGYTNIEEYLSCLVGEGAC